MPSEAAVRVEPEARRAENRRRRLLPARPDRIPSSPAGRWRRAIGVDGQSTPRRPWAWLSSSPEQVQCDREGHLPAA